MTKEAEIKMRTMASLSPRAAILEAWAELEAAGMAVIAARVKEAPNQPRLFIVTLAVNKLIESYDADVLESLRKLRNHIAHSTADSDEPSEQDALMFAAIAGRMTAQLRALEPKKD